MKKNGELFDEWNKKKKNIEFYWNGFKRTKIWEIWIDNIWINIGNEISKDWKFQRPVLICTKWMWWDLVWIIPITTKYNENLSKYLIKIIDFEKYWLKYKSYLCINQFWFISKKRLVKRINSFNREKYIKPISIRYIKNILEKLFKII